MGDLTFAEPLHMLEGSRSARLLSEYTREMLTKSSYSPWVAMIFGSIKTGSRLRAVRTLPFMKEIINRLMPNSLRQKQVRSLSS